MKNTYLRVNKPCSENWYAMTPNEKGKFCDHCAKTVIDFSNLNPIEITQLVKNSKGSICGRMSESQLEQPLFDFQSKSKYNLPYAPLVSGIMIAATLATAEPLHAENKETAIEFVPSHSTAILDFDSETIPFNEKTTHETEKVIMKGKVVSPDNKTPIEKAKITFVTIKKMISTYTSQDGSFYLEIPADMVDDANVIRVTYEEIINKNPKDIFYFEAGDYILTKNDFNSIYTVKAKEQMIVMGGISRISSREQNPIVVDNGREIKFEAYIKGRYEESYYEKKDFYYFKPEFAVAIYGKRAKNGLYILMDKK